MRKSANALVSAEMRPHLPTTAENMKNALRYNSQWWADHLEALKLRFDEWVAEGEGATEKARF